MFIRHTSAILVLATLVAAPASAAVEVDPGRVPLPAPITAPIGFTVAATATEAGMPGLDADFILDMALGQLARPALPAGPNLTGTASPLQRWLGSIADFIWGDAARNGHPLAAPVQLDGAYPRGTSVAADMFDKQASWGQMILGFALVGLLRRRRQPSRLA